MDRKPLEGIESLAFLLGGILGYFLAVGNYSWWIVTIVIIGVSVAFEKLVKFLRAKNRQK